MLALERLPFVGRRRVVCQCAERGRDRRGAANDRRKQRIASWCLRMVLNVDQRWTRLALPLGMPFMHEMAPYVGRAWSDLVDDLPEFVLRNAQHVRPVRELARLVEIDQLQACRAVQIECLGHHDPPSNEQAGRVSMQN